MAEDYSRDAEATALDQQAAEVLASLESHKTADAENVQDTLCATWRRIRPFITAAVKFIPLPNIRRALELLIELLDGLCPA
jgi:hypothetical protein